jgi:hypothetical protein
MKKLTLLALISLTCIASADEVNKMATIDGETIVSEYSDNGLPKFYELMSLQMSFKAGISLMLSGFQTGD